MHVLFFFHLFFRAFSSISLSFCSTDEDVNTKRELSVLLRKINGGKSMRTILNQESSVHLLAVFVAFSRTSRCIISSFFLLFFSCILAQKFETILSTNSPKRSFRSRSSFPFITVESSCFVNRCFQGQECRASLVTRFKREVFIYFPLEKKEEEEEEGRRRRNKKKKKKKKEQ